MHGFYIEKRHLTPGISLSQDLAQHIFIRGARGAVVVVSDQPQDLASTTKKQWNSLIRLVRRERSSTLKATRIRELSNQIEWMQRVRFTAKHQDNLADSIVIFATIDRLLPQPPNCSTLYLTTLVEVGNFHLLTSWLPNYSVVVLYDLSNNVNQPRP